MGVLYQLSQNFTQTYKNNGFDFSFYGPVKLSYGLRTLNKILNQTNMLTYNIKVFMEEYTRWGHYQIGLILPEDEKTTFWKLSDQQSKIGLIQVDDFVREVWDSRTITYKMVKWSDKDIVTVLYFKFGKLAKSENGEMYNDFYSHHKIAEYVS